MKTALPPRKAGAAFTLIEVMIALGIFFMAVFAILGVIASGLKNARSFQRTLVSGAMVLPLIATNNNLEEGMDMIDTSDLEKMYPGYRWRTDTEEVLSNRLFRVDIVVEKEFDKGPPASVMSVLKWSPNSKPGHLDGGFGGAP
jgi:hypothetical protein